MNNVTLSLLKECDSGAKMSVTSLRDMAEKTQNSGLKKILEDSIKRHEELGAQIGDTLREGGENGKEPNPMAKMMSHMKITVKATDKDGDREIAALCTDGCNMGIKQLSKCINDSKDADEKAIKLANAIVEHEEGLIKAVRPYL